MKILITGASGFIGKSLVAQLLNYDVTLTLVLRNKSKKFFDFQQVVGDLNSKLTYEKIKDSFDVVVHIAGYVPKKRSDDLAEKCIEGNIKATETLIKNIKTKKLIFISTCEVYGSQTNQIVSESDTPKPISNYAKSKLAAEKRCKELCKKYGIQLNILRLTTIYGPEDKIKRAIPNFVSAAKKNETIKIYGDGSDIRDYLFINDAIELLTSVIINFKPGVYNVSSGKGISIQGLARTVIDISKSNSKIV
ncbi:MAG: NAD(P)-dependent oxidoreductase, partial [Patescibacteria group bacterium]|nr:NAD(P)-dependent oxidoreductase [Patescibacteria group bacterium]